VAANNPGYQAFATAFTSLQSGDLATFHSTAAINDTISKYQQATFSAALTNNTDAQNVTMFGRTGAAQITQILSDAKAESGIALGASYYAAHIRAATTAKSFAADAQLVNVALGAYGISSLSATNLQRLLTEDPTASGSLAQQDPQYLPFAKAFSYAAALGGRTTTATANITAVQTAYQNNQLRAVLKTDIPAAAAQNSRNTAVRESTAAPLNLYQMLGDSNLSTVIFGAYSLPETVGALTPDQQVEALNHTGFTPQSLNSPTAVDSIIKRYMANTGAASTATSPVLQLFTPATSGGQMVTLDLSFLTSSTDTSGAASSPNAYLISLFS
jgi:hypothetical protein